MVLANVVHFVVFRLPKREQAEGKHLGWGLQKHLAAPARVIFLLSCVEMVLPLVPGLSKGMEAAVRHGVFMVIVVSMGWFCIGLVYVAQEILLRKYDITVADNRRARSVQTQFQLFRRIAIAFVVVLTIGALLWTFDDPRLWHYGSGLLASAGLASFSGFGGEDDGVEPAGGVADCADRADPHR